MFGLTQSLQAWNTPEFEQVLKQELQQHVAQLPLQQGLSQGSYVLDAPISVMISRITQNDSCISIHAGVMYQGIIAGCSCADDPSTGGETTEYCELLLELDTTSGQAVVRLLE